MRDQLNAPLRVVSSLLSEKLRIVCVVILTLANLLPSGPDRLPKWRLLSFDS